MGKYSILKIDYLFLLLVIPLVFTNLRSDYDWTGDTALLLNQAENIIQGKPHHETLYIYNPENPILSPSYYPVFTPILFSLGFLVGSNPILTISILISLLYILFGFLTYKFLSQFFSQVIAAISGLLLLYNQFIIRHKEELMSDIPFAVLAISIVILANKTDYKKEGLKWIFIGILSGLAIATRSMGWVFPLALLIQNIIENFFSKTPKPSIKQRIKHLSVYFLSLFALLFLLNLLFPAPQNGISIYKNHFSLMNFPQTLQNIKIYLSSIIHIFASPMAGWGIIGFMVKALFTIVLAIGLYKSKDKKFRFSLIIFMVYFAVLIPYPYSNAPVRFLLPVIPIILLFFLVGLDFTLKNIKNKKVNYFIISILIIFQLIISAKGNYYNTQNKTASDLTSKSTKEAFIKIAAYTKPTEIIQFNYPRIIAYYTKRKSYATKPGASIEIYKTDIQKFNANFILISEKYSTQNEKRIVEQLQLKSIWKNDEYELFKILKE